MGVVLNTVCISRSSARRAALVAALAVIPLLGGCATPFRAMDSIAKTITSGTVGVAESGAKAIGSAASGMSSAAQGVAKAWYGSAPVPEPPSSEP